MKKVIKKKLLIGGLTLALTFGGIGVGMYAGFAANDPAPNPADELRAYYIDGSTDSSVVHTEADGTFESTPNLNGLKATLKYKDTLVLREVIDLKQYDYKTPVIKISVAPETIGVGEFFCLKVDLVDVYDESNYVTVQFKPYSGQTDTAGTGYHLAYASNGQAPTGKDTGNGKIWVNQWGMWRIWNFAADKNRTGLEPEEQYVGIAFDMNTNGIYGARHDNTTAIIADLDDPEYFGSKLWDGFTTGEVYARVYCEEYQGLYAHLVVQQYGDFDLTKPEIVNEEPPRITVDYQGYNDLRVPTAVVGKSYPLFNATALDLYSGKTKVNINVYTDYYATNKRAVAINKRMNTFVPEAAGSYYVEYSSMDNQGNKSVEVVQINAVKATADIIFDFEDYPSTLKTGDAFALPSYTSTGGSGNKDVAISAVNDGVEIPVIDGIVRAVKTGKLVVTYKAIDYIGQEKTQQIEFNVISATEPTFIEEPVLPIVFIEGQKYTLPKLNAYNYMSGNGEAIATTVSVKSADGSSAGALEKNEYKPAVKTHGDLVTVAYTAMINGESKTLEYDIPVYKVTTMGRYDATKYFQVSTNTTKMVHLTGVDFTTTATDANIMLLNPISSTNAAITFKTNEKTSTIAKISVMLIDYENLNNQIKFTYDSNGYVYVNDNQQNRVNFAVGFGANNTFTWKYNNTAKSISYDGKSDKSMSVNKNLNGGDFEGFAGAKFYLVLMMEGVTKEGGVTITNINGHTFNIKESYAEPIISIKGAYSNEQAFGTVFALPNIVACDIQDGEVDAYVTVRMPNGSYATDEDGVVLNRVLVTNREVKIKLNQYGTYVVEYEATDNTENTGYNSYVLYVADKQKPVITLSGEIVAEGKVDDLIDVPNATATDNRDKELEVRIYLVTPTAEMIELENGKKGFKAMAAGIYRVVYMVRDAEGNMSTLVRTITIKEG